MKIAVFALSAAVLGLAGAGPASALTPAAMKGLSDQHAGVALVDYKKGPPRRHHQWHPGGRYKHAPKGWHRYDKRPGDWRTRGCVIVGPIWWCP